MSPKNVLILDLILVLTGATSPFCEKRKFLKPVVLAENAIKKGVILHLTYEGDIEQLDKSKASFMTIIEKSVDILTQSEEEEHVNEFLEDFYFTTDGKSSVWAKALKDRKIECQSNVKKLKQMQDAVKTIFEKWLECRELTKQCKCFFEMHSLLEEGSKQFKFGGNGMQSESIFFDLNIAYNMMSLILYHLTIHVAIFAPAPAITIRNAYFKVAESMLDSLDGVVKNITKARVKKVSDVEICRIEEILWQEYKSKCECYNCEKKSSGSEPSQKESFYSIAGNGNLEKFNAKVIDRANNTIVCDTRGQAKSKDDQRSVELDLYSDCLKLRKPYIKKLKKETKHYYDERVKKIRTDLPTIWGINRKKYARKTNTT